MSSTRWYKQSTTKLASTSNEWAPYKKVWSSDNRWVVFLSREQMDESLNGPSVGGISPSGSAASNSIISFTLLDQDGNTLPADITIYIEGNLAYQNEAFVDPYNSGSSMTEVVNNARFDFVFGKTFTYPKGSIAVRIVAEDQFGNTLDTTENWTSLQTAAYLDNENPADDGYVDSDANIVFDVLDADDNASQDSIDAYVDGVWIMKGGSFVAPYTSSSLVGVSDGYRITLDSDNNYSYGSHELRVVGTDNFDTDGGFDDENTFWAYSQIKNAYGNVIDAYEDYVATCDGQTMYMFQKGGDGLYSQIWSRTWGGFPGITDLTRIDTSEGLVIGCQGFGEDPDRVAVTLGNVIAIAGSHGSFPANGAVMDVAASGDFACYSKTTAGGVPDGSGIIYVNWFDGSSPPSTGWNNSFNFQLASPVADGYLGEFISIVDVGGDRARIVASHRDDGDGNVNKAYEFLVSNSALISQNQSFTQSDGIVDVDISKFNLALAIDDDETVKVYSRAGGTNTYTIRATLTGDTGTGGQALDLNTEEDGYSMIMRDETATSSAKIYSSATADGTWALEKTLRAKADTSDTGMYVTISGDNAATGDGSKLYFYER